MIVQRRGRRWRRLRPTSRDADLADGLAAAVHDPLWMLCRQWQVGEFRGEDAGSPVDVDVTVEHDELDRFERRGERGGEVVPYEGGPLESAIERERVLTADPPARIAAEAGTVFLETLEANEFLDEDNEPYSASDFDGDYRLSRPTEPMPERDRRYYRVVEDRVLDGATIFDALRDALAADPPTFEDVPLPEGVERLDDIGAERANKYVNTAEAYCEWYLELYDEPGDDGDAWRPTRLEYDGAVVTGSGDDENTFELQGYTGGRLHWHAFSPTEDTLGNVDGAPVTDGGELESTDADRSRIPADDEEPKDDDARKRIDQSNLTDRFEAIGRTERIDSSNLDTTPSSDVNETAADEEEEWLVPTPVTFPGMPSPRWWEVENAGLLFGDVSLDGSNLVRMLVHEFALTYGNDWFRVPIEDVPVGALTRIPECTVTDSFGVSESVTSGEDDEWRLFSHDLPNENHNQGLFLPPTVSDAIESDPVEEVLFGRDPMANLVFALERLVEGTTGEPIDRTEFRRPRLEIVRANPNDDPDEEFVELANSGDDAFSLADCRLEVHSDGELDAGIDLDDEVTLDADKRLTVYTGDAGVRDGIGIGTDASVLEEAETVSVVRFEESDDVGGGDDPDSDDPKFRRVIAKRALSTVDEADAAYRLASTVPDHWYPFSIEPTEAQAGVGGNGGELGSDGGALTGDDRLLLSILLDAASLDVHVDELPLPEGRLLDPEEESLPKGDGVLKLHEDAVTRSGRTAERHYQYVHWADGTVHCWSGRTVQPGYGELASALRFDVLDDLE
ncbi:lamin tail domain-containing protein [Halobacteria archaeon AArc-m2/3/4]|uniref:Lamin tail domain-containing protein n=1 Tax=Natronoglomus mannanivorans TaxID=2979990 RepID=A0ABT2QAG8_9EURY|nr:lamin tail domain-containing protein [Halobacteria archaeon AArc-m2/3/4]